MNNRDFLESTKPSAFSQGTSLSSKLQLNQIAEILETGPKIHVEAKKFEKTTKRQSEGHLHHQFQEANYRIIERDTRGFFQERRGGDRPQYSSANMHIAHSFIL